MSVTIVMPVLDGMPWLPEAVESVLSQGAELIVLDPGSTDGSRDWLRAHASDATLIFEPDDGQTDALDRGLRLATGDVLGWLNADDVLEPDALAVVEQAFYDAPDAIAVSGRCSWIDERGEVTGAIPAVPDGSLAGLLACPWNLPQPATFFQRSAYGSVGGLDTRYEMAMDVDLWMRLAGLSPIVLLPETLARFRVHPAAKSQSGSALAAREDFAIRRKYGMRPGRLWLRFALRAWVKPLLAG